MTLTFHGFTAARVHMRRSAIVALTSLIFVIGCVSLDKPPKVASCAASSSGCLDDERTPPEPGLDASSPDASPDLSAQEAQLVPKDAPLNPEVAADAPKEALPDVVAGPDASDGADLASHDVSSPDVPADAPIEAPPELDVGADRGPDSVDVGSDTRRDVAPDNAESGNCINQLIAADYVVGTVPACSKCLENGASLEAKCKAIIDCLVPPCTKAACYSNNYCQNTVGGSAVVNNCVAALVTAACPNGF